jgi:hypothetical protein
MDLLVLLFISGSIWAIPIIAFVANETEEYRIARAIKNGNLRPKGTVPEGYDSKFCQFPRDKVRKIVYGDSRQMFCSLVGMKSTGKSTELQMFGLDIENKNIIYCKFNDRQKSADLDGILYETMHKSVFNMPGFLYEIAFGRPLRRHFIENIFRKVLEDTQEPVTIVLDITPEKVPTSLNSTQLVKEIKHYVADAKTARCLFAAPKGMGFEVERHRELRLTVLIVGEISIEASKNFLKHCGVDSDDNHLKLFPRTFSSLIDYSVAKNKDEFVKKAIKAEVLKIEHSYYCGVCKPWFPFAKHPVKTLYQTALTRNIGIDDISNCGLNTEQFNTHFVDTNIFQQTSAGTKTLINYEQLCFVQLLES